MTLPVDALGTTGLEVTPIGLGLAALGRPAYITTERGSDLGDERGIDEMKRRSFDLLDSAYDAGVRYFDVARSYGRAEEFLAAWLERRNIPRGRVTVGSKWGYSYVGKWQLDAEVHEIKDHSLQTLRRQHEESRALLDEWLSLYQIHSATLESGVLDDRSVLVALAEMSSEGLVVGLSVSGPHQPDVIRKALEVDVDGVNPFRSVQCTWNLLEPSAGPALADAHREGWGVIVKEGVANGRLTDRGDARGSTLLQDLTRRYKATIDALALAAVLANRWTDVALSGAVSSEQLAGNLRGADIRLDDDDLAQLSSLAEPPDEYWERRSSLPWS